MSRIERQMELPEEFHEWSAESKVSHLMSMRSRVLKWHRYDISQFRFGQYLNFISSTWWFFAVAILLGASWGANQEWFTGINEIIFDRFIDMLFMAFGWMLHDLWWRKR